MMKTAILGVALLALGNAAEQVVVPPLKMVEKDRMIALSFLNATHVTEPNNLKSSTGALVYTFHSDATCSGKADSGVGYVYGECISGDGVNGNRK